MKLKLRQTSLFMLLGIMTLAFGVRVFGLAEQSFTADEVAEIGIARTSLLDILHTRDGFPPLYHFILHGWLRLFNSDLAARWLSALLGCASVFAMWQLAPGLEGRKEKFWTAFLLALSPFHIWYSQEARAYVLYFFFALLALGFFSRAWQFDRKQDWLAYALAGIAGLFTHYFFAILLALNAALLALFKRKPAQPLLIFTVHLAIALSGLIAAWLFVEDIAYQTACVITRTPFDFAALGYTLFTFIAGYSLGRSLRELHFMSLYEALPEFLPWLALLSGGLFALLFAVRQNRRGNETVPGALLFALILIPVLLCGALTEMLRVSFKTQYLMWAAIPLLVWLGRRLARLAPRWRMSIAVSALGLMFAAAFYNRNFVARYQNEDVQNLALYLQVKGPAPVLVLADYMENSVRHYLQNDWAVHALPAIGKEGQGLEQTLKLIQANPAPLWLVYTRPFHGDPGGRFKSALFEKGLVQKQIRFAGIELYQVK